MKRRLTYKILSTLILANIVFGPLFVIKAQAQWAVVEVGPLAYSNVEMSFKEKLFDAFAFGFMNYAIQRISASTVNWINSGFRGSPSFVTNPGRFLEDTANLTVGSFIQSDPRLNFLCGPIQNQVRIALINSYRQNNLIWQCTLTDAIGNMQDFMDDFDRGGWDKFFEISQRPQNNPIGAYIMAESALQSQLSQKINLKQQELSWGRGFLSYKKCTRWAQLPKVEPNSVLGSSMVINGPDGKPINLADPQGSAGSNSVFDASMTIDTPQGQLNLANPQNGMVCAKEETQTPGSVIESQLNDALGAGLGRLQVADEINEIVGALLTQLANKALGGLLGLSRRGSDGSNPYTSQFQSDSQDNAINKYFNDSQDNLEDTINSPVFDPSVCIDNPYAEGCSLNWNQGQPQNPPGETNP